MEKIYRSRYRIRFGDCDCAGIVFHPKAFQMTNTTTEDWFRKVLDTPFESMLSLGFLFPIVHIECDFLAQMHVGDEIVKELAVKRVGTSSLEISIDFFRGSEKTFSCREVMVCIDVGTRRSKPIPEGLRTKLLSLLTDQTGSSEKSALNG